MLTIHGKRWFERVNGNTYHSVAVYDGKRLVGKADFAYGYGDQYRQTALDIAVKAGLYSDERYSSGGSVDYGRFQTENLFIVCDVTRKKDLRQ